MNKTNVLNSDYEFEGISRSYSWEGGRSTFPFTYWVDILVDFLHKGKAVSTIEKEYRKYLPKAKNTNGTSNNMYTSVLLRRMLVSGKSKGKMVNMGLVDAEKAIREYMLWVILSAKNKYDLKNKWRKEVDSWIAWNNLNINNDKIDDFVKSTNTKYKDVQYKFNKKTFHKDEEGVVSTEQYIDNEKTQMIGEIGEDIVFRALVNKFGIDNVYHTSKHEKYSPYDIKVVDGNKEIFYEIKSSTRIKRINWFISRSEVEFYKKNKKSYKLIFVRNVYPTSNKNSTAIIDEIENPEIIINQNMFGVNGNKLWVTPIKYKGLF